MIIFDTAHRATGSSSHVIYSKQYRISLTLRDAGIITHTHAHTHAHSLTHFEERGKTDYSGAGEGVTNRAASEPLGTFCHERAAFASNLTRFVTMVTKRARVTKRAATRLPNSLTQVWFYGTLLVRWDCYRVFCCCCFHNIIIHHT